MAPPTQTFNLDVDAISGICGSVSIACWVVVFSPQIIQNFQRSSADALSVQFIIVWLLGDVFNIIGAVLQGVLPTMIILAIYYTIADIVLLAQCFYYRGFTWRDEPAPAPKPGVTNDGEADERTQLLSGTRTRERRDSDWTGLSPAVPHMPEAPLPRAPPSALQTAAWNGTIIIMVCVAGVLGWFLGRKATGSRETPSDDEGEVLTFSPLGQFFGYLCAVAYVASRLPQLVLNWRRKTTDGLSMLFFLFACLGNITYVLSIFAYDPKCREKRCQPGEAGRLYGRYMLVNLSWLLGALITLFLDLGVFAQYFIYLSEDEQEDAIENGSGEDQQDQDHERWDQRPLLQRVDSSLR